jgi:hypothetical protein
MNPQDVNHVSKFTKARAFRLDDGNVAVGLLTRSDLHRLGQSFAQAWPLDQGACFSGLLETIDEAERQREDQLTERLISLP